MHHNNDLENLKDDRAERRERKKRPRMSVHARALKKASARGVQHIHKVTKQKRKKL